MYTDPDIICQNVEFTHKTCCICVGIPKINVKLEILQANQYPQLPTKVYFILWEIQKSIWKIKIGGAPPHCVIEEDNPTSFIELH